MIENTNFNNDQLPTTQSSSVATDINAKKLPPTVDRVFVTPPASFVTHEPIREPETTCGNTADPNDAFQRRRNLSENSSNAVMTLLEFARSPMSSNGQQRTPPHFSGANPSLGNRYSTSTNQYGQQSYSYPSLPVSPSVSAPAPVVIQESPLSSSGSTVPLRQRTSTFGFNSSPVQFGDRSTAPTSLANQQNTKSRPGESPAGRKLIGNDFDTNHTPSPHGYPQFMLSGSDATPSLQAQNLKQWVNENWNVPTEELKEGLTSGSGDQHLLDIMTVDNFAEFGSDSGAMSLDDDGSYGSTDIRPPKKRHSNAVKGKRKMKSVTPELHSTPYPLRRRSSRLLESDAPNYSDMGSDLDPDTRNGRSSSFSALSATRKPMLTRTDSMDTLSPRIDFEELGIETDEFGLPLDPILRRRERNRLAAARSRLKKMKQVNELEDEIKHWKMEARNWKQKYLELHSSIAEQNQHHNEEMAMQ